MCVGADDVRGCYDPILVVGLNVQNEIRPYNPPKQKSVSVFEFSTFLTIAQYNNTIKGQTALSQFEMKEFEFQKYYIRVYAN